MAGYIEKVHNVHCDYHDCTELIRDKDRGYKPETKKYCERHGAEFDEIVKGGNPAKILSWWVKSMNITGVNSETINN